MTATFFRAELYPDDTLLLAACAKWDVHVAEGCSFDLVVGWNRLPDESDDDYRQRAATAHAALCAPLADVTPPVDDAPVPVDLSGLGVTVAPPADDGEG